MTQEWYIVLVSAVCLYSLYWIYRAMNSAIQWISETFPVFNDFTWLLTLVIAWLIVIMAGIYISTRKGDDNGKPSKS